jgi:Flp pilus assembly pilin Flp
VDGESKDDRGSAGRTSGFGRCRARAALADERGQTFVEYTMILGLVTAIIIVVTGLVVPGVSWVVVQIVNYLYIYLT